MLYYICLVGLFGTEYYGAVSSDICLIIREKFPFRCPRVGYYGSLMTIVWVGRPHVARLWVVGMMRQGQRMVVSVCLVWRLSILFHGRC